MKLQSIFRGGKSESHAEADNAQASRELQEQTKDPKTLKQQLDEQRGRNEELRKMYQNLENDLKTLQGEYDQKEIEAKGLNQEKAKLTQQLEKAQAECKAHDALSKRLWPACLNIPALETYAEKWRSELEKQDADPVLLSMFANIFAWSGANEICFREAASADPSIEGAAITAIHNFSRFLFINLQNEGLSPEQAEEISYQLLDKINGQLMRQGASYKLEQPVLGSQFSSKSMDPASTGTVTGVVAGLCTWAVTNAQGTIYNKKARVVLARSL